MAFISVTLQITRASRDLPRAGFSEPTTGRVISSGIELRQKFQRIGPVAAGFNELAAILMLIGLIGGAADQIVDDLRDRRPQRNG